MPLNSRAGRASWRSVSPTTISRSCGTSPVPLPAFDSYRGARRPLARSSQRPPHQADGLIARTPRRSEFRYAAFPFRDARQCGLRAHWRMRGGDGDGHAQSTVRSVNVGSYPGSARLVAAQRIGEECHKLTSVTENNGFQARESRALFSLANLNMLLFHDGQKRIHPAGAHHQHAHRCSAATICHTRHRNGVDERRLHHRRRRRKDRSRTNGNCGARDCVRRSAERYHVLSRARPSL